MKSITSPYSPAWFRTMEKINPLLTNVIRHTARSIPSREYCAICGCQEAESHDLLMQGHLISLSSCTRCYALHGAAFRDSLVAAGVLQARG